MGLCTDEYFVDTAETEDCSFCYDRKARGYWFRGHFVGCCSVCAVDVLPRLMADSIILYPRTKGDFFTAKEKLREAEVAFWKGVAARLSRSTRSHATGEPHD